MQWHKDPNAPSFEWAVSKEQVHHRIGDEEIDIHDPDTHDVDRELTAEGQIQELEAYRSIDATTAAKLRTDLEALGGD